MNPIRRALLGFWWHRMSRRWKRLSSHYWRKHCRAERELAALPRRTEP
jgi:hypothetical protein